MEYCNYKSKGNLWDINVHSTWMQCTRFRSLKSESKSFLNHSIWRHTFHIPGNNKLKPSTKNTTQHNTTGLQRASHRPTYVWHYSAHVFCPVAFLVWILQGFGKGLIWKTSECMCESRCECLYMMKSATQRQHISQLINDRTSIGACCSFKPKLKEDNEYVLQYANIIVVWKHMKLYCIEYLMTQMSLLSFTTVWSKSNIIRVFIFPPEKETWHQSKTGYSARLLMRTSIMTPR